MILPNKYIQEHEALIGVGLILLNHLSGEKALSNLWESVKETSSVGNFERFVLGLDLLFVLGLVEFRNNKIIKVIS
jgi:hypothetical protein